MTTQSRIEELEARRQELAGELEDARESGREAAVGTAKVSTLAKGQTVAAALERALEDVDQELARLRDQEAAEAAEDRLQEQLQAAQAAAAAATAALEDLEDARATLDLHIREQAARVIEARRDHAGARQRFLDALRQLTGAPLHLDSSRVSTDPEARQAVNELVAQLEAEGTDLEAVRMALTGRGAGYLDRPSRLAELPTDELIGTAIQVVTRLERRENR